LAHFTLVPDVLNYLDSLVVIRVCFYPDEHATKINPLNECYIIDLQIFKFRHYKAIYKNFTDFLRLSERVGAKYRQSRENDVSTMRLNFSCSNADEIYEGIGRMAEALKEMM